MLAQFRKGCAISVESGSLINTLVCSTMVLLVFSSIVIISIISVTPIVVLAIGELGSGQRDIIIEPKMDYLNATKISELGGVTALPRIKMPVVVDGSKQAVGWLMDFKQQMEQHLGTIAGDQPLNHSYIYVHQSLGFKKGQKVNVQVTEKGILKALKYSISQRKIQDQSKILSQLQQLIVKTVLEGEFTVREVFDTASGKFGIGQVNQFVYFDICYAIQQIISRTLAAGEGNSPLLSYISSQNFSFGQFASQATVNLPDRVEVYSNPNYEQSFIEVSSFGKKLLQKIGLFSVQSYMPLAQNLVKLKFVGMFLGVTFQLLIFSLFLLSVLMMNNMFRVGIERRNFDFALLKVMGANRLFIVANILTGSLKYVIGANLLAYPLAYGALYMVSSVFQDFFGYRYEISPSSQAVVGGLFIGVLVPIVASIAPIWSVIRNDLAENLNPLRNKTEATKIETYIEGREFPFGKVIFGGIATSFGLMIYYLLPRALINSNLSVLLVIFFIILEGLLIGLIILAFSVQYFLEKVTAYLCLFWANTTDFILTLKNLSCHRFRNRGTAILYALSVAFIVFVSVGLQIQLQTMYIELLKLNGSYIVVTGDIDRRKYNDMLSGIDGVEDWAYVSLYLRQVLEKKEGFKDVLISDKARIQFVDNRIYAVSPNLINTFFYQKVSVIKTDAQPPYDPYSYLYSPDGLMTCTISKDTSQQFGIFEGETRQFNVNVYYDYGFKRIPLRYTSVFSKRMGLLYSPVVLEPEIGVSFDTFREIAGIPKDKEVPIGEVKVKVRDRQRVKEVADRIRSLNNKADEVWDYTQLKSTLDKIDHILTTVTYILLTIVLTISFFSLLSTTYINVFNQTKQIATLMILGYGKERIVRLFVYENLVLVVHASVIGLVVGYLVAQMMGLQREIFSELPIDVQIKGVPFLFAAALISSFLSTYQPLKQIFELSIVKILNYSQ